MNGILHGFDLLTYPLLPCDTTLIVSLLLIAFLWKEKRRSTVCNVDCIRWGAHNLFEEEVKGKRVIEVGSYDVNGSLRYIVELIKPTEYIGVDIIEGPGVDIICSVENLVQKFGKDSFDIVLSTCTLEHIRNWKKAISNIKNVCKPNGIILIIVPSDWPFHVYPYDFWRYSKEDIKSIFSDCDIMVLDEDFHTPSLVYGKIRKPYDFTEIDLSAYQLYSVILNKRIREIQEADFENPYFRRLVLKNRIKNIVLRIGRKIERLIDLKI
jgi:SAM-dependent methyltransferase